MDRFEANERADAFSAALIENGYTAPTASTYGYYVKAKLRRKKNCDGDIKDMVFSIYQAWEETGKIPPKWSRDSDRLECFEESKPQMPKEPEDWVWNRWCAHIDSCGAVWR